MPELDISDEATLTSKRVPDADADSTSARTASGTSRLYESDDSKKAETRTNQDDTLRGAQSDSEEKARETPGVGRAPARTLVVFTPDDPGDPRNWSEWKKRGVVAILCILSFVAVFGSSSYAPGEQQVQQMFGASPEVASLGLTVYVLGFAFGPLLCPMSEMYGRRLPYVISWPILIAVIAPSAWANNLPVILVFRFFAGLIAGCPLNNGTGIISDLYASTPRKVQKAIGFYAFTALSGPVLGSMLGFFIAAHLTHGLWVIRVHWFMVIAFWPLAFLMPETHGPSILAARARKLRKESGRNDVFAAHELHSVKKMDLVRKHVARPFAMLVVEPIVMGAAVWVALSYSIIYFFFEAFPVVFVEQNHFQFQLGGLPFLGITLGMIICILTTDKLTRMSRHVRLPFVDPPGVGTPADAPEAGLKVVLIACVLTPISLFWFAWTSSGDVHWISPAIAGVLFGYSMLGTFYSFNAYSTQIFTIYASSASASNAFFRSVVASVFPIIAHPILNNLGTEWGVSLFGFLSLGLVPIPLLFIRYGPVLREKSHFGREARRIVEELRHHHDTGAGDSESERLGEVEEGEREIGMSESRVRVDEEGLVDDDGEAGKKLKEDRSIVRIV